MPASGSLELPLRRWRNARPLAVTLPLALATGWALTQPGVRPGAWAAVFPLLALQGLYRLWRPRVPLALQPDGIRVDTGLPLTGLRTLIPWEAVSRLRTNAAGQLLVELRDRGDWLEQQPWRTRANVRASRRRAGAAVAVPVRELQAPPGGLLPALEAVAPVPVGAVPRRGRSRSRR